MAERDRDRSGPPAPEPSEGGLQVTLVSGLPRSGTSMMMRALEAGGLPPLADGARAADEDNPRGYYELEEVKRTVHDPAWLVRAAGHAVKVIAYLLKALPVGPGYRVVFMRRELDEILRSQRIMLARRAAAGQPAAAATNAAGIDGAALDVAAADAQMRRTLMAHVAETEAWLRERADIDVLYVSYNRMLAEPRRQMERVGRFLCGDLDIDAMIGIVDPSLYRQRPAADRGQQDRRTKTEGPRPKDPDPP